MLLSLRLNSKRVIGKIEKGIKVSSAESSTSFQEVLLSGPKLKDFIQKYTEKTTTETNNEIQHLPSWLKTKIPFGKKYTELKKTLRELKLSTVCEEAHCPNIGECWSGGKDGTSTATIMVMGDTCTRGCRFCSIKTSKRPSPLNPNEPENIAEALRRWGLSYVVLTSVDRDDIEDGGSLHLSLVIKKIKEKIPSLLIECLSPDFNGNKTHLDIVCSSGLDVFAHNIETVERLTPTVRDYRATYTQSMAVLAHVKESIPNIVTKTSIMLGLNETDEEVLRTMKELREINVDVITLGQYMRPSKKNMKVGEYISPEKFKYWEEVGQQLGFAYVASGPLVRSSYRAGEFYLKNIAFNRKNIKK